MADPKTTRNMHFVHPLFDYFLIGGGLSLVFLVLLFAVPGLKQMLSAEAFMATTIPFFILLSNNTHFAASTVRLYTKPGSYKALDHLETALRINPQFQQARLHLEATRRMLQQGPRDTER